MKKLSTILFHALVASSTLASMNVAHAGYANAGQCTDAVIESCNAKGGSYKGYMACVNGGVNQCLKAFPEPKSNNQADPALKLRLQDRADAQAKAAQAIKLKQAAEIKLAPAAK